MNRPHMLGCTCGCFVRSPAGLGSVPGASSPQGEFTLPREIAGVRVPDTALAKTVTALVRQASPTGLFNHVVRSYVLGTKAGEARELKFDAEQLFVAAIMHDIGLVDPYIADARFEVDSANAAAKILRDQGYSESKIDLVWQAIALHSTREIPELMNPIIALVHLGAFMDGGFRADLLTRDDLDQLLAAVPRLDSDGGFVDSLAAVLRKKPHTAYLAFERDIAERTNPNFRASEFRR